MDRGSQYLTSTLWFLAGGIAGAGISLLLAPQSGRATRQMMAGKVRGTANSVRDFGERIVTRGEEIWDETGLRVGAAAAALSGTAERNPGQQSEAHLA